jgi:phage tail sheath protein FI
MGRYFAVGLIVTLLAGAALAQRRAPGSSQRDPKVADVERVKIALQKQIAFAASERNTPALWSKVRLQLENSLTQEWRNGRLQGTRPSQAFFVKCDRTTMTQDDLDNGRLIVLVGLAFNKPAEFAIVRLSQWTADHH